MPAKRAGNWGKPTAGGWISLSKWQAMVLMTGSLPTPSPPTLKTPGASNLITPLQQAGDGTTTAIVALHLCIVLSAWRVGNYPTDFEILWWETQKQQTYSRFSMFAREEYVASFFRAARAMKESSAQNAHLKSFPDDQRRTGITAVFQTIRLFGILRWQ